MRSITPFAVVGFVALLLLITNAGYSYADQASLAVANLTARPVVDQVVGTENAVPIQLVRGGGRGGGHSFHSGFRGARFHSGFRGARFHSGFRGARFHKFRFAHHRHFRPFFRVYAPYYSYYYNDCWWNGYRWVCPYYYGY